MQLSIIVPTFNEGENVEELLNRLDAALGDTAFEVIFVDDSTDDTPDVVRREAARHPFPVRVIHRDEPTAGLGGAVVEGFRAAQARWCVVMDGDLQHPPEDVPTLYARASEGDADVVVASRYMAGGEAKGLADTTRTIVSRLSTLLTKAMFPTRLAACSDPMTGFFLVDLDSIDVDRLKPRGFKILLEVLARHHLRVAEIPFRFDARHGGSSKASLRQGVRFLAQLTMLRFGRMSAFAIVGGIGAVANLAIMSLLIAFGMPYLWAAIIASEITIISNFLMLEYLVFADMRADSGRMRTRFLKSFTFNNIEAIVRIPVIWMLVENAHVPSVLAAAITLLVAFVLRFMFHALVVYKPKSRRSDQSTPRATPDTAAAPSLDV